MVVRNESAAAVPPKAEPIRARAGGDREGGRVALTNGGGVLLGPRQLGAGTRAPGTGGQGPRGRAEG